MTLARLVTALLLGMAILQPAACIAASKADLTIYTLRDFTAEWGPGPEVKARFEKACKCQLRYVAFDDVGSLLARLRLEGAKSQADIVLGMDTNYIVQAKATGLFASHQQDIHHLTLPLKWRDLLFIPYDYSYYAFVYDDRRLANPPSSFEELLDPSSSIRVVVPDPRTSTPGLGLLEWVRAMYKEKAGLAWKKLTPKIVTITKSWGEAYAMFRKGEADMVLSYVTSPVYHITQEKDTHYHAALFSEGHYMQVEVAGQLTAAPHPERAAEFLRFMLTPPFQKAIAERYFMYPVISIPLSDAYATLIRPSAEYYFSPEESYEKRNIWLDEWLKAIRGGY